MPECSLCSIDSGLRICLVRFELSVCSKTYRLQGDGRSRSKGPDHEAIWADMIGAETSTFILTCAVPDDPMVDMLAVAGLVEGHAYGILDVRDVSDCVVRDVFRDFCALFV